MAGKAEMRRAFAPDRDHVLGRPVGRLAHHPAVHGEAERLQRRLEHVEHLAARRSDAWAVDQRLRKRDGVERHSSRLAKGQTMPKVDLEAIEQTNRTGYPPPFNEPVAGRWYRRVAPAAGLTDFGASHVMLEARRLVEPAALARWRGRVPGDAVGRGGAGRGRGRDRRSARRHAPPGPRAVTNGHHLINAERARLQLRLRQRRDRTPAAAIPTST